MKLFFISFLLTCFGIYNSIHSISITTIAGDTIQMNQYSGKKIMIVNIATQSNKVSQLAELQQLAQAHSDSLVIIGVPSNSFGNEPLSNTQIITFMDSANLTFPLTQKCSVKGNDMIALYNWLTNSSENGVLNQEVKGDFQKFIINGQGELIGSFSGSVSPGSTEVLRLLNN